MNLEQKAKKDNLIMQVLKVSEINHAIAITNKGSLTLRLPYKGTAKDYRFVLDAVPLPEKLNKELINLYFKD